MSAFAEYMRVLRVQLRMSLNLSSYGASRNIKRPAKEKLKTALYALLGLIVLAGIFSVYAFILYPLMSGAASVSEQTGIDILSLLMAAIILVCMTLVLILGTLTLISIVFLAKDAETYAALPLRPQTIFSVKFSLVYLIELAIMAVLFWPAVVIYSLVSGLNSGEIILLVIRALPIWLLMPLPPLAIASVLSMLFTRLTALFKRRDLLLSIFGFVLVVGLMFGQVALGATFGAAFDNPEHLEAILTDNAAMLEAATAAFPPATWSAQGLLSPSASGAGMGYLGLIASCLLGAIICLLLSRKLYYKGVLAQLETPKTASSGYKRSAIKSGSVLRAYFSKELKLIIRSPVYASNILISLAIFPIMLVAVSFSIGGGFTFGGEEAAEFIEFLRTAPESLRYLLPGAFVLLTGVMCTTSSSTSYSREGRYLWLTQSSPVSVKTQLASRLLAAGFLAFAGSVASLAVLVLFVDFSFTEAIFGFIVGLSATFPVLAASIIPDTLRPKLKWNTEAEAFKQNFNSVLSLLLSIVIAAAIGFMAFGLTLLGLPIWAVGGIVSAFCIVAGVLIFEAAARLSRDMLRSVSG